jgi:hypothetical protein
VNIRFWAVVTLDHMAADAEPALPALRKALRDEQRSIRIAALACVGRMRQRAHPVADELLTILLDPKADRAETAVVVRALRKIGVDSRDLERVLPLKPDASPLMRIAAAHALAATGDPGVKQLAQWQRSGNPALKDAANQAMPDAMREQQVRQDLKQLDSPDAATRRTAAIGVFQADSEIIEPIAVLSATLRDRNVPVAERLKVAGFLKRAPSRVLTWPVVLDLREAVKDPSPEVRAAAAEAFLTVDGVQADMVGVKRQQQKAPSVVAILGPPPVKFDRLPTKTLRTLAAVPVQTVIRYLVPNPATAAAGARPVLVLERPTEPAEMSPRLQRGILARELIRQSFAMTARERLGLVTRDLALREVFAPSTAYSVKSQFVLILPSIPASPPS